MSLGSGPLPGALAAALADRYRVERELGRGGMATVYLAHDLRHDRQVAIKVLHEDLGATLGPERFLAEIKTTARLQHPHILPLLDSGAAGGLLYYVMPYVEGETLRARLQRETQLPIEDAVRIAREVADALGFAHGHGIVHRDIKPENILLQGGHALVADFGIALAVQQAGGTRLTQTGLSLGTPQYMSPEQAMGDRTVDHRSDVYALGAVTYEMLTGDPPFTGSSVQAIVARVLNERPTPPSMVRDTVPPHVEAAVLKALAKLPADRFATAAAFDAALTSASVITPAAAAARPASRTRWGRLPTWARVTTTAVGLVAVAAMGSLLPIIDGTRAEPSIRLTIDPPPGTTFDVVYWAAPAVTPDGQAVVFAARGRDGTRFYVRHLDDYEAKELDGTQELIPVVSVSPDGQWAAGETIGAELVKFSMTANSAPILLGSQKDFFGSGAFPWLGDSLLVRGFPWFVEVTPASPGAPRIIARPDSTSGERQFVRAVALPDGRVLASIATDSGIRNALLTGSSGRTWIAGMDGAEVRAVLPPATVIVVEDGRFFAGSLKSGTPRFQDRHELGLAAPATATISAGGAGTIAYFRQERGSGRRLVWVDRRGIPTPIPAPSGEYRQPRLSPDGNRVAVYGATADRLFVIELVDVRTGTKTRVSSVEYAGNPVWSVDGRALIYSGGVALPQQVFRHGADGGTEQLAFTIPFRSSTISATRDGTTLLESLSETMDIFAVNSEGAARLAIGGPRSQRLPVVSPDGRWVAYMSNETGGFEVYVQPWPGLDHKWAVSTGGGTEPIWSRDGRELYFRRGRDMMVSRIAAGGGFRAGRPEVLFDAGRYAVDPWGDPSYDVAPDGRFLMIEDDPDARVELRVEVNALRARATRPAEGSRSGQR